MVSFAIPLELVFTLYVFPLNLNLIKLTRSAGTLNKGEVTITLGFLA